MASGSPDGPGQGGAAPAGAPRLHNTHPALRRGWHPVALSAEVGDGPRRVWLLGEPWVLYRAGGTLRAFADRCPHRLAPLSLGACEGDSLRCRYHGWRFDGSGACVEIPALGPAAARPPRARLHPATGAVDRYGVVWLCPSDPLVPLPEIPEADDPAFMTGHLEPATARSSAGLLADNFLDMAHFPFVHRSTFGADEAAEVPSYTVERRRWSFTAAYEHLFANREDPGVEAGLRPLVQRRRLTYRYDPPFHLALRIDFLDAGGTNVIGLFIQPEAADRCRIYSTLWRDDLGGDPARMAEAVAFEQAVLAEDLVVQEAYDDLSVPLDLTVELHTRADRTTVELRRVLADLVAAAAPGNPGAPATSSGSG